MTNPNFPPIFDGHNDVLSLQIKNGMQGFADGYNAHIDLPKARAGGLGGGFYAIWARSFDLEEGPLFEAMRQPQYDLPLPAQISQTEALQTTMHQAAVLSRLERQGALKICISVADIRTCLDNGTMAAILHMEGAEAIDTDFNALEVLYRAGLRSLGPVWSRDTVFGYGVPFRYPSTPDIGPGLTDAGKDLVRQCNRLGIMLDMSHLNAAGFWDVVKLSDAPIVATHSNAHAVCPHARNLTDDQLAAIRDSDGMVGINFAVAFLRPDGQMHADTGFDVVMRHLDHLITHLGEDRVGFGSDFDGALVPAEIGDASGLTALRTAMRAHGVDEALMEKLCNANWLRLLGNTWQENG